MKENTNQLISIVLPVYNGEKYLKESIDSVIAQTYENWELIIIDDCSTDSSPEIAKNYAKKDSRINYFRNEQNKKLPKSLNKGFSLSKGDFLTWTSDDNRYLPEALEKMLMYLLNEHVDLVCAGSDIIDDNDCHLYFFETSNDIKVDIWAWNHIGACFLYTRRIYEEIGGYNENQFLVEDYDYWLRVCSCFEAYGIRETLYVYRTHPRNLTNTARKGEIAELCEKMLLKNASMCGKLNKKQKYRLYTQLNNLRARFDNPKEKNKYKKIYTFYKIINLFGLPDRIKMKFVDKDGND